MAGHNKWSKIKHKKAVTDKAKGANFTRVIKMIKVAARNGADPNSNAELRLALEKAKEVNMPKENIQRALDKASSNDGQEVLYEGFANDGIGLIIKAYTDNINRTVSEVRHALSKNGGSLGTNGSVMWMFTEVVPLNDYQVSIPTEVDDEALERLDRIVEALEELDDVDEIWTSVIRDDEDQDEESTE